MNELPTCPVCQGTSFTTAFNCKDYTVSHETFTILRCSSCEFLLTYPRPLPEHTSKYYVSAAYASHVGKANSGLDRIYQTIRQITLKWKLSLITKSKQHSSTKTLLDFGCGTGEFLRIAKLNGWKTIGMEPSELARKNASSLIIEDLKDSVSGIEHLRIQFDIITLWHVLEHIEDLNETIRKLKRLLKEKGTLFVAVPNHKSWDSKFYREFWAAYDVPRHLWHFDRESMNLLATNHGLKIVDIIPMWLDAFYICLLSEKYSSPNSSFLAHLSRALLNGFKSNMNAKRSTEYSSLIYVITR